jgi:HK97 family phage major capsid protein
MFGLKLVEENQIVNGDGTGQNLSGLLTNSTAYSGSLGGTNIDQLGRAAEQVALSGFMPDAFIVSLQDAWSIFQTKSTIQTYILSDVQNSPNPKVWGLPLVISQVLPVGTFLAGAFKMAVAIWDRADATIEISREHQDVFVKNLIAILCEERLALTVYRSAAIVHGSFVSS